MSSPSRPLSNMYFLIKQTIYNLKCCITRPYISSVRICKHVFIVLMLIYNVTGLWLKVELRMTDWSLTCMDVSFDKYCTWRITEEDSGERASERPSLTTCSLKRLANDLHECDKCTQQSSEERLGDEGESTTLFFHRFPSVSLTKGLQEGCNSLTLVLWQCCRDHTVTANMKTYW